METQQLPAATRTTRERQPGTLPPQSQNERNRELILIVAGSMAWLLLVVLREQLKVREPGESLSLVRFFGTLLAGPVALKLLLTGERNKLIAILLITLALAGSGLASLRELGQYTRWGMLALVAMLGINAWRYRPQDARTVPHGIMLGWTLLAMASSFYALHEPEFAFQKSITLFLLFGSAMLYAYYRFSTPEWLGSAVTTLGRLAAVFFLANLLLWFSPTGYLGGRFRGITENPNTLGGFFTIALAVVVYMFFAARRRRGSLLHLEVLLYAGLLLGSAFLLYRSGSRAGLLGAFAGSAVFMFISERRYFVRTLILVVPIAAMAILVMPNDEVAEVSVTEIGQEEQDDAAVVSGHLLARTASGRTEAWAAAWGLIKEHPFKGTGWGTTRFIFEELHAKFHFRQHRGLHVHNSYIEMALELGLPAALVFCLMLIFVGLAAFRTLRHVVDVEHRAVIGALIGAYVGALTGVLWESWLIAVGSFGAFEFWLVFALLVRVSRTPREVWQS